MKSSSVLWRRWHLLRRSLLFRFWKTLNWWLTTDVWLTWSDRQRSYNTNLSRKDKFYSCSTTMVWQTIFLPYPLTFNKKAFIHEKFWERLWHSFEYERSSGGFFNLLVFISVTWRNLDKKLKEVHFFVNFFPACFSFFLSLASFLLPSFLCLSLPSFFSSFLFFFFKSYIFF